MHPVHHLSRLEPKKALDSALFGKFARQTSATLKRLRRWTARGSSYKENILLACHPRGGSTWLAEIVSTLPNYHTIWEPFNPIQNRLAEQRGFKAYNYFPEIGEKMSTHVENVLKGRELTGNLMGPYRGIDGALGRLNPRASFVFKCTNANMMLAEVHRLVPLKTIVLLRHPCAVVSSQLSHGAWDCVAEVKNGKKALEDDLRFAVDRVLERHPDWRTLWNEIETLAGVLAFVWGLRTLFPLQEAPPQDWCFVTYEDLVEEPGEEIERIFEYLERPIPRGAYEQIGVTSASKTTEDSNVKKGADPLRTWKSRLSSEQTDRILRVIRKMGIRIYSEGLRPSSVELERMSREVNS